jgi:formylglycine-generating enzyme required for sulfatase activity
MAWVQDRVHYNYTGAPADGRAWEGESNDHVVRGSDFTSGDKPWWFRSAYRLYLNDARSYVGLRLARDDR